MSETFQIGPYCADPSANEIIGETGPVRVGPKAMATLVLLQAHRGEVVERREICDHVGLSDEGLSRTISELRKTIEIDPRQPQWLQTIPRRGYRLNHGDERHVRSELRPTRRVWTWTPALTLAALALGLGWWLPSGDTSIEVNPDIRRLTAFAGQATRPQVSNNTVVFERFDNRNQPLGIWQLDLDSLALSPRDSTPGVQYPVLSDGSIVATLQAREGRCQLSVADTHHACRDAGASADFHAKRGWIAFEDVGGGISRVGTDGTDRRRLTNPPVGQTDRHPRFSPDGSRLLFTRGDDVNNELQQVSAAGGAVQPVTNDGQMVFGHDWLDDTRIVFSSDRQGERELWLLPGLGKTAVALGGTWAMAVDADSDRIVFERPAYRADILEVNGSAATPLIESARYDNHPRFSPDGSQLVFLSNRTGRPAIWLAQADGGQQQLLVDLPEARLSRPRWAGNDTIVFTAFDDKGSQIHRATLDGRTEVLVDASWSPLEAVGSVDRLWFIGHDDAGPAVFQRHSDGRIVRRYALDARQIEIDSTGQVYLERADRPGVFNPDKSLSVPIAEIVRSRSWVVNGDHLVWASLHGVLHRRLSSGEETLISALVPDVVGHGMEISPDGERLLVARTTGVQIDLFEMQL